MVRRALPWILLGACSEFSQTSPAPPPAPSDAGEMPAHDAGPPPVAAGPCRLDAPFGEPVPVEGIHVDGGAEYSARFTDDGLTATISRITSAGDVPRLYISSRADVEVPFGPGDKLAGPIDEDTGSSAARGLLLDEGRTIVFEGRPAFHYDVLWAKRPSAAGVFEAPSPVPNVNTWATEGQPYATDLALYFVRDAKILRAERAEGGFRAPEVLANIDGCGYPVVSRDDLTIYMSCSDDVFVSQRANRESAFPRPSKIEELSTPELEETTDLSPDGCTLYLSRGAIVGERRIFAATRGF